MIIMINLKMHLNDSLKDLYFVEPWQISKVVRDREQLQRFSFTQTEIYGNSAG
jgi:hypothetical protein